MLHPTSRRVLSIEKLALKCVAYTMWFRKKGACFAGWYYGRLWENEFIWTRVTFWFVTEIQLFQYSDQTPLHFCQWFWLISEVCKRNVDTREELLFRILDATASTKNVKADSNNTRSSQRSCRVHCGCRWDLEYWFWSATISSFLCNKFVAET